MVRREALSNGMTLLVEEVRVAPVVAMNLWVGTGAADDPARLSGVSHFLEHMLLKGRNGEERGPITRTVQDAGGYLNAQTGSDHTAFYQVVPSLHWQAVLEAQAKMLESPEFEGGSVDAERSVIVEETRMSELNPSVFAWRRLMEMVFGGSGYGRGITGTEGTLADIDAGGLAEHFRRWYQPGNMVQVVVGDVDSDAVVARARELLGEVATSPGAAERRVTQCSAGGALPDGTGAATWTPGYSVIEGKLRQPYLLVGFSAPPVCHDDVPVLDVLCGLLGSGRSSRLRKSLQTTSGLVSGIGSSMVAHRDVGIVAVRAIGTLEAEPSAIVGGIFEELERLRNSPVDAGEMKKSISRLESGYLLEHETVESEAMTLGFFETMGDHTYAEEYIDRLAAVTPDDVKRVANAYLDPESVAVLAYVPEGGVAAREGPDALASAAHSASRRAPRPASGSVAERESAWSSDGQFTRPNIVREATSATFSRTVLPCGATLVVRESPHIPLVSVALGFRGGFVDESDALLGVTNLTLKHMLRGTRSRTASQLADAIEGLGSGISVSVDRDGFGIGASVLSKHLAEALAILGELACRPAFDTAEFEMVRTQVLADLAEAEDNASQRTMRRLVPMLFPGHPYGRLASGTPETISSMSHGDLSQWHSDRFATANLFVCMSGDVSAGNAADELERVLSEMPRNPAGTDDREPPRAPCGRVDEKLDRKGQSSVAVGYRGPHMGTRESAAMHVLSSAMTMMGGRLWRALRERPPYAYSVRATPVAFRESGALVGYVTTQPDGELKALETFASELSLVAADGLTPDELERGRRYLAGMLEISMQQGSTRAASYALAEVAGVGYEHVERLPAMVRGITRDDVVNVARRYLTAEDGPAVAILRG